MGEFVSGDKKTNTEDQVFIYTHRRIDINYNEEQVRLPWMCRLSTANGNCALKFRHNMLCSSLISFWLLLQVIQVNLTSENPQALVPGAQLEFVYSVKWEPSEIKFGKRFERYLDYNFFEHQVKSLS